MIFDTCFLIDLMDNNGNACEKLLEIERKRTTQKIPTVAIFELFSGAGRCNNIEAEKSKIVQSYNQMLIVGFNERSAKISGELFGKSIKKGRTLGITDCMIAGIALDNNEAILTRNIKHFESIEGLKIETY